MTVVTGGDAGEDSERLEHTIVSAARNMASMPSEMRLATMVAVEDAVATIRTAFDNTRARIEIETVAALAPKNAPLAA